MVLFDEIGTVKSIVCAAILTVRIRLITLMVACVASLLRFPAFIGPPLSRIALPKHPLDAAMSR